MTSDKLADQMLDRLMHSQFLTKLLRLLTLPKFWRWVSVCGSVVVWTLLFNHKASFSLAAPQSTFGISLTHDQSMNLMGLEIAGAFLFAIMFVASLIWQSLKTRPRREYHGFPVVPKQTNK